MVSRSPWRTAQASSHQDLCLQRLVLGRQGVGPLLCLLDAALQVGVLQQHRVVHLARHARPELALVAGSLAMHAKHLPEEPVLQHVARRQLREQRPLPLPIGRHGCCRHRRLHTGYGPSAAGGPYAATRVSLFATRDALSPSRVSCLPWLEPGWAVGVHASRAREKALQISQELIQPDSGQAPGKYGDNSSTLTTV